MNKSETIKRRQENEQLRQLVKQWTRAEIMARFGRFKTLEYADYYMKKLDIEGEMRELVFGTSSLVNINHELKIVKWPMAENKKTKKRKKDES